MKGILSLFLSITTALSFTLKAVDKPVFNVMPSYPAVAFPALSAAKDIWFTKFTVSSSALGTATTDQIQVYLKETKAEVTWVSELPTNPNADNLYGKLSQTANELDLWLPWHPISLNWPDYHGIVAIKIGISGNTSDPYRLVISTVRGRWWPVLIAALATLALMAIPILLINTKSLGYEVAGKKFGKIEALFIEKETDSYSISRFQFYLWSAAAIFGYIVLTVARTLIQGSFEFADIPQGLPGIIFISAATAATAQGITSSKGAKGAGPIYPSLSDFVTTGGEVVPERFQFFVWTILGVVVFLFLVVFQDPQTLMDLPKVPDGFLAIMGISSFGYLGGRLARKPGPIVDTITAVRTSLRLTFSGRKLSSDCSLKVDSTLVDQGMVKTLAQDPDDQGQPPEFYKTIIAKIDPGDDPVATKWTKGGRHSSTIINADGQQAQWLYRLDSIPLITGILPRVSAGTLTLTVRGEQLSDKAIVSINDVDVDKDQIEPSGSESDEEYVPPNQKPELYKSLEIDIANWQDTLKSATKLVVKITNPDKSMSGSFNVNLSTPTLTKVEAESAEKSLRLILTGEELAKDAAFSINNSLIASNKVNVTPEDPEQSSGLFKKLTILISDASKLGDGVTGSVILTNPDGRKAAGSFDNPFKKV